MQAEAAQKTSKPIAKPEAATKPSSPITVPRKIIDSVIQRQPTELVKQAADIVVGVSELAKNVPPVMVEHRDVVMLNEALAAQRHIEEVDSKPVTPNAIIEQNPRAGQPSASLSEAVVAIQQSRLGSVPAIHKAETPLSETMAPVASNVQPESVTLQPHRTEVVVINENPSDMPVEPSVEVLFQTVPSLEYVADTDEEDAEDDDPEDTNDIDPFETEVFNDAEMFKPQPLLDGYVVVNFKSVETVGNDEQAPAKVFTISPELTSTEVAEDLMTHLEAMPTAQLVEASNMVSRINVLQERLSVITEDTNPVEYQKISELIEVTGIELMQLLHIDCEPSQQKQFVQMLIKCLQSGDYASLNDASYVDEGTHEIKDFGRLLNLLKDAARNMQAKLRHYIVLGKSALTGNMPVTI